MANKAESANDWRRRHSEQGQHGHMGRLDEPEIRDGDRHQRHDAGERHEHHPDREKADRCRRPRR